MNDTITTVNTPRLIDLARWLTDEERKRRLGHDSEWSQDVWISAEGGENVQVLHQGDDVIIKGWSCGTAACAAGHIALEDGGMPAFYRDGEFYPHPPRPGGDGWHEWYGDIFGAMGETISEGTMFFRGQPREIDAHAREALGLADRQASQLFDGANEWPAMMRLIGEFTGLGRDRVVDLAVGDIPLPPDPDGDEDEDSCDCGNCG